MNLLRPAFLALALVAQTGAHSVWIEPLDDQLVIRFAEPGGRLEKSPGHLDSLATPVAFTFTTNQPTIVTAMKSTNHFAMAGAATTAAAGAEASYDVLSSAGKPSRRPVFYARWQPGTSEAATPALTLDLVPTGKRGEVRVWFRGQPLGGVKATLRSPDDTDHEVAADSEGFIRFEASGPGQYLLTVAHHREKLAGHFAGRAYDLTSHNASLCWRQ